MSKLVSLRNLAALRLTPPRDERWIERLRWVPLSPTEIQLACRYFPLAVRIDKDVASVLPHKNILHPQPGSLPPAMAGARHIFFAPLSSPWRLSALAAGLCAKGMS